MGKKFVSLCIAFLMLFGISVQNSGSLQVYADGSTEIVKTIWDPAKWISEVLTKTASTGTYSNAEMCTTDTIVKKPVTLPSSAMINASVQGNVYANVEDAAAENASLKLNTNLLQISYNSSFSSDLASYPVLNFSYKMYIPNDANKDKLRSLVIYPGYSGAVCKPVVNFENGKVTVAQEGTALDLTSAYTKECTYSAGMWIPVQVKAYFKRGSTLSLGIYVGNELIFHGYTKKTLDDTSAAKIGISTIKWSSDYETINADSDQYKFVTTYLDDIKISLLTENQKPLDNTYITYFDYDSSKDAGDPQLSGSNKIVAHPLLGKYVKNSSFVHASSTNNVSPVAITDETATDHWMDFYSYDNRGTESEPDYILSASVKPNAELDGTLEMVQNFRGNIETYTTQTEDCELVLSYDIFIPEGTEQNARIHTLSFNGTASGNSNTYLISSKILGKKLSFDTEIADADDLLIKRSEEVDFTSGEWHTVTYLLKLHYNSTANSYDISIYGIYNGERIFGNKVTMACAEGTSGAFRITQQKIRIFSVAGGANFETKYDDLNLVYYPAENYYDNSTWRNANYAYPILLTNAGDGKVNAKARLEGYDDGVLIVAFYDNSTDKKLISVKTVSDRSGENSEYLDLSGLAIPGGSSYVRAFLLNDLSKMTPYTLSSDITIE